MQTYRVHTAQGKELASQFSCVEDSMSYKYVSPPLKNVIQYFWTLNEYIWTNAQLISFGERISGWFADWISGTFNVVSPTLALAVTFNVSSKLQIGLSSVAFTPLKVHSTHSILLIVSYNTASDFADLSRGLCRSRPDLRCQYCSHLWDWRRPAASCPRQSGKRTES